MRPRHSPLWLTLLASLVLWPLAAGGWRTPASAVSAIGAAQRSAELALPAGSQPSIARVWGPATGPIHELRSPGGALPARAVGLAVALPVVVSLPVAGAAPSAPTAELLRYYPTGPPSGLLR